MWIQRMIFPCVSVTDLISLLVVVCILLTIGVTFGVNNNKRRLNFRKTCSCKWTRRRAYWMQKSVFRADYIALALRSKTLPGKFFNLKSIHTIGTHEFDGTGGLDGNQKCPLKFFILCMYIDKVYSYLYR